MAEAMDALTRSGGRPGRLLLAAILVLGAAGCASGGTAPGGATRTAGSVARPPVVEPARTQPVAPAASPAASLVAEARALETRGSLDEAGSLLERAVRLDPGNAEAWLSLARLRDADGDPQGARDFALRALSVAGDEPETARSARRFLDRLQ
jgi:tetratricopeptide (TPR) repeat protein